LPITKGKLIGTKLRLLPDQREFIQAVYGASEKIRLAIYSQPRGNGKTGLIAGLTLCHLLGPEAEPRGECYSAAKDLEQAGIIFREMEATILAIPEFAVRVNITRWHKRIEVRAGDGIGSTYAALTAEAHRAHGLSPTFWAFDEMAQAADREMFDNLQTGMGKRKHSLGVVISTQASDDDHPLSQIIDDAKTGADKSIILQLRSAPPEADPFDPITIRGVNPALGIFLDESDIFAEAERAKRMPSFESAFRNLRLNQRVALYSRDQLFTPQQWERGVAPIDPAIFTDGRPVFGGLDLSARADLTALVLAAEDNEGNVHLMPFAWMPADQIAQHMVRDRAPYDVWIKENQITAVPGSTIDYDWCAQTIGNIMETMNVVRINFDRWRIEIFRQSLARFGVAAPMQEMRQSFQGMTPCIEAFEALVLAGKIRHGGQPLLRWCFANAAVTRDAQNNRKLDKAKAFGRIDVAVAALMAVGAMKASTEPTVEVASLVA
jgi:phage terminase large subunit-like protein